MRRGTVIGISLAVFVLIPDAAAGVAYNIAAVALAALLVATLVHHRVTWLPAGLLPLAGYFFCVLIATLAQERGDEVFPLLRTAIPLMLLALLATATPRTEMRLVLNWIFGLALIEAVVAISQRVLGWPVAWGWLADSTTAIAYGENFLTGEFGRTPGTMAHGIPLAALLASGIIIAVSRMSRRSFFPLALSVLAMGYAIALTGSRSAVIVLAVTAVVMVLLRLRNPVAWTFIGLAAIVGASFLDLSQLTLFRSLEDSISFTQRAGALETFGKLIEVGPFNALFGNGWAMSESLVEMGVIEAREVLAIDNGLVTAVAMAGLGGAGLLLVVIVRGIARTNGVVRAILIFNLGMFMSFDVTLWAASFAPIIALSYLDWHRPGASNPASSRLRTRGAESLRG